MQWGCSECNTGKVWEPGNTTQMMPLMSPCTDLLVAPSAECAVSQEVTYWALKRKQSTEQLHIKMLFVSSMLLEFHGKYKRWRFHYAMKNSLFRIRRKGIGQDLKINLFNFADLLLFWHGLYLSTHCARPCFPMCYVWYKCWPECYWASVQNCRHLNTAAGVFPTSIIGHMQRMTVGGKAPHAILCWFIHLCIKNLSLNAEVLLTGTELSS